MGLVMTAMRSIWIGYDPREDDAFRVARSSILRRLSAPIPVHKLVLAPLIEQGLYRRPTQWRNGSTGRRIMWDVISDAPMSTEHANARFLVPTLAKTGLALFLDADMLVRCDLTEVFDRADISKAVSCVQHNYQPAESEKMDGQVQTRYQRKNWSSFLLFNCDHPANRQLTLDAINTRAGRDLHRFCWLKDHEIGALPATYNHLVGDVPHDPHAKVVHHTNGVPSMEGYENCPFADEWRAELASVMA